MSKAVLIKTDFNLYPRREGRSPFLRYGLPACLMLLVLGCALAAGIIIPRNIMADKIAERDALARQIADLSPVQAEYAALSGQIQVMKNKLEQFDRFTGEEKTLSNMLDILEQACPMGIRMDAISFDYEKITISGASRSDAEVASFAVRLRASGSFASIHINTVTPNAQTAPEQPRAFSLLLYYPVSAPEGAGRTAGSGGGAS